MEVATGHFPYPKWSSVFEQLYQVVQGDPPRLTPTHNANTFTAEFVDFVNTWLVSVGGWIAGQRTDTLYLTLLHKYFSLMKDETLRPKYNKLLQHPFIINGEKEEVDVAAYVCDILDAMANNGISAFTTNQP